jgi:hypothetical protein
MSEVFKLYKTIEFFIDNNCLYNKNEPFVITYYKEKENSSALPTVNDGSNFIQCIMNIPKEKEDLLKDAQNNTGIKINVLDSSFEFILYKNSSAPSVIKCILLLIINNIEKVEVTAEPEAKSDKTPSDINSEYHLLEKLKKFIFNYIKKNKKASNNELETILLGNVNNDIRFFNHDKNGINYEDENIKKIIEIIKTISSKLDIKPKTKKNEENEETEEGKDVNKKEKKNKKYYNDINQVLDALNPDYKNELINRYLDEMPEELVNLMKRYKNINFTQNMYNEYIDKNKNTNEIEDKKDILKDENVEDI